MFRVQYKFKDNLEIIKNTFLAVFAVIFYLQTTIA